MLPRRITYSLLIACCALVLFVPFLGASHLFDWDEINFAECAREMVVTGDYSSVSINYEPFWEKPPLFIWMQALSMRGFGIGEFAARFPNALCGALTLLVIFQVGRRVYDERFGLLWVMAYAGSLLPHFYFRSGIIDPWFNLFIFSGTWFFIVFLNANQPFRPGLPIRRELLLAGACLGLAVMTKGPAALVVFGLCFGVYMLRHRFKPFMSWRQLLVLGLAVVLTGSIWFTIEMIRGRANIISEFFAYQVRLFRTEDAGHGGPFYYHFLVLLIGCFPAVTFALHAFLRRTSTGITTPWQAHVGWWMKMMLLVVLILFSLVKTKIIHYSSLTYFPLTFLAARTIYRLINGETEWRRWMNWLLGITGGLLGLALCLAPFVDHFKGWLLDAGLVGDRFAAGNLQAAAHWKGIEWIPGALLLLGLAAAYWWKQKGKMQYGIFALFGTTLAATSLASGFLAPRVEEYSQSAAVRFYESLAGKNVYVETLGFKSYAHYFYAQVKPGLAQNPSFAAWKKENEKNYIDPSRTVTELHISMQRDWLLRGNIDRPAYFVCKNTFENEVVKYYPKLRRLRDENGFVFWERLPGDLP